MEMDAPTLKKKKKKGLIRTAKMFLHFFEVVSGLCKKMLTCKLGDVLPDKS